MNKFMGKKTVNGGRTRTFLSVLLVLAMLFSAVMPNGLGAVTAYADEDDEPGYFIPEHDKSSTSNGDGTYTLELSVTGDADTTQQTVANVNVLIIYDRSSSMTTNRINGSSGWNASGPTRADAAEKIVYDFVHKLFSYKTSSTATNIQMALATFAVEGDSVQGWTSTESDIVGTDENPTFSRTGNEDSARQDYSTNANGTNWEDAFTEALSILKEADGDPTFVMMVTDGAPSASGTSGNNPGYPATMTFEEFYARYSAATENAFKIQNYDTTIHDSNAETSNTTLYGIYAYGSEADLLDDLIYYSLKGSERSGMDESTNTNDVDGYYFNARNNEQVIAAVESIFSKIVESLGVSSVSIKDGTTSEVAVGSEVANLLEVDESSYKYWLSIDLDGSNQFKRVNMGSGVEEVYTVTENDDGTCTVTWGSNSVDVKGSIELGTFKYQWEESNALYEKDPPEAKLNGSSVDWDLSTVGTLLDSVTYSVTFTVYPSQTTLDYVADIMNDPYVDENNQGAWGNLPPEIQKYIGKTGDLETNTTASLSYLDMREDNPTLHTEEFDNPPAVSSTAVEQLAVSKKWENEIDNQEQPPVTLYVTRDGEETYTVTLASTTTPAWEDSVYISVGIMGADGQPLEGSEGHDFTFTEPETGSGVTYHWELNVPVVHPMLIKGERTMLIKVDDKHPLPDGATTYTFKDYTGTESTYYVDNEQVALTATNERRSRLFLKKVVTGEDVPADAKFPFTIKVDNPLAPASAPADDDEHESDYWVWISPRDAAGNSLEVTGATQGDGTWWYAPSGTEITVYATAGCSIMVNNLPTGTEYTITEGTLPTGFVCEKTEFAIVGDEDEDDAIFEGGRTSKGTITATNQEYYVTYTNKYELINVSVNKVWADNSNQDGKRPETLTLTLNGLPTGTTAPTPEITKSEDGNTWTYTWKGVPKSDAAGEVINYTVSENSIPQGYTCAETTVSAGGTITNSYTPETETITVTKVWDDSGNKDGKRPTSVKFTVTGSDGNTYEATLTAPEAGGDTWTADVTVQKYYNGGTDVTFEVDEEAVSGYTKKIDNSKLTITNSYSPETETITVTKIWDDKGDQDGKRPATVKFTVTGSDGKTYEVTLKAPEAGGDTWTADVTVEKFYNGGQTVTFTVDEETVAEYTKKIDNEKLTITNSYTPESITVTVTKVWDDNDDIGGIRPESIDVQLTADGKASGEPVTLSKDNEWTYTWTVDKYANGKEIEYSADETAVPKGYKEEDPVVKKTDNGFEITLTNTYSPESVIVDPPVQKIIKGNEDLYNKGDFTFTIECTEKPEACETAPMPANTSVTNTAEYEKEGMKGYYEFGEIEFTVPGTYVYTVKESGDVAGVTKDPDAEKGKTLTFTVKDNGEGVLTVTPTTDEVELSFTNVYEAEPTTAQIMATKVLTGKTLEEGQFSFTLTDSDGKVVETVKNTAAGSVVFSPIEFTEAGEYTYTIAEVKGSEEGITYDTKTVTATVKVTDDGKGALTAEVTYDPEAKFENTYEEEPPYTATGSFTPEAKKVLEGRDLKAGEFSFTLTDSSSKVIETKTNTADGKVTFSALNFTEADAGKTFTYTITEVKGSDKDVTYDEHTVTLTIKVTDNGDGTLKVEGTYSGDQTFKNKYTEETPKTGDTARPILWIVLAAAAVIGIIALLVLGRRNKAARK